MALKESPSPAFAGSIGAALRYWQARLETEPFRRLDAERHNLYRAVHFGLGLRETEGAAAALAVAAFDFVLACGYWREWLQVLEQAARIGPRLPAGTRVRVLMRLGQWLRLSLRREEAVGVHREMVEEARGLGEPLLLAEAHYNLGRSLRDARRYDEARAQLEAAQQLLEPLAGADAADVAALVHNALGRVALDQGRLEEAGRHLEQAVAIRRQPGPLVRFTDALHDLGNLYRARGAYEQAMACYEEALSLLAGGGYRLNRAQIHYSIGVHWFLQQEYGRAEAVFREMDLPFLRETGNLHLQAMVLTALGNSVLYQDRPGEAATLLRESIALWEQMEDELEVANAVGSLGEALAAMGQTEEARALFVRALALAEGHPESAHARYLRDMFGAELDKLAGQARQ